MPEASYQPERRSLLFFNGFDASPSATALDRLFSTGSGPAAAASWIAGRRGHGSALRWTSATPLSLRIDLHDPRPADPKTVGLAFRFSSLSGVNAPLVVLRDGATAHFSLYVVGVPGGCRLDAYGPGPLLESMQEVLAPNAWHYLELAVEVATTAGSFQVRVDQAQVLGRRGVNTRGSATSNVTNVLLMPRTPLASGQVDMDDVYVATTEPPWDEPQFLGDLSAQPIGLLGNGAGGVQFSPVGAAENWDCVNDASPADDDATYARAVIPGVGDLRLDYYRAAGLDRLRIPGRVLGLGAMIEAREEDGATLRHSLGCTTRDVVQPVAMFDPPTGGLLLSPGPAYEARAFAFAKAPSGRPWEAGDVGTMEVGLFGLGQ